MAPQGQYSSIKSSSPLIITNGLNDIFKLCTVGRKLLGGYSNYIVPYWLFLLLYREKRTIAISVFSYRVARQPQGGFGVRFSLCDLSAESGEFGNLRLRRGSCCSLLWQLGYGSFPADLPLSGNFPGNSAKNWEVGCWLSRSCGDKQRCFLAVRRRLVGEGDAERLLCDRLPGRFWLRFQFS